MSAALELEEKKKPKHCEGPWKKHGIAVLDARFQRVATCHGQGTSPEQDEANALLIASAPQLLEALRTLCHRWSSPGPMGLIYEMNVAATEARRIIKIAEGK
jgi:hypothetical protein